MTRYLGLAILACLVCVPVLAAEIGSAEKPALDGAMTWLNLCDAGDFGACWDTASAYFKGAVSKENLAASLQGVRPPLGETISRKVDGAQHATSLPGAPDGEYIVFTLTTAFANKASAVETVTVMKDADGVWRIAGYFIR